MSFFYKIFKIGYFLKSVAQSIIFRKRVTILNTPIHGNLGDHAILLAEEEIVNNYLPGYKIIKFENSICYKFPKLVALLCRNGLICFHGGGYLGDFWPGEDKTVRNIIPYIPEKKIIFFPQTFYSDKCDEYFQKNKSVFESKRDLILFARDKYTFRIFKKHLANKVFYSPDVVLFKKRLHKQTDKNGIIVCLRGDVESNMDSNIRGQIMQAVNNKDFISKDTIVDRLIFDYSRKRAVGGILKDFSSAKLVITDRLHGMIFSYLAKTPCLVFNSKSPKILGVYEWLKKSDYIILHDEKKNIREEIESALLGQYSFNAAVSRNDFEEIKNVLLEMAK